MSTDRKSPVWEELKNTIKPVYGQLNFTNAQIIFGILQTDKRSFTPNWANLILKYFICICKWKRITAYHYLMLPLISNI